MCDVNQHICQGCECVTHMTAGASPNDLKVFTLVLTDSPLHLKTLKAALYVDIRHQGSIQSISIWQPVKLAVIPSTEGPFMVTSIDLAHFPQTPLISSSVRISLLVAGGNISANTSRESFWSDLAVCERIDSPRIFIVDSYAAAECIAPLPGHCFISHKTTSK